jgi:manganese/iron transport system permease protein
MSFVQIFAPVLLAALLGGGSAGLVGVFTLGLGMPFLAVCMAHAAMAGAVFASLLGWPIGAGSFAGALVGTLALLLFLRRHHVHAGGVVGLIFSFMLGLAFLGIGLQPGSKEGVLGLMWGSLLFADYASLWPLATVSLLLVGFICVYHRELKLLLFSRALARSLMSEGAILGGILLLSSAVITVNLERVGGLLLYSLVCNPALAAMRVAKGFRACLLWSAFLGALSAVTGFLVAYWLDLPVGACIVLVSSLLVGLVHLFGRFSGVSHHGHECPRGDES